MSFIYLIHMHFKGMMVFILRRKFLDLARFSLSYPILAFVEWNRVSLSAQPDKTTLQSLQA